MATDSVIDAVAREFRDFHLEDVDDEAEDPFRDYCIHAELFQRRADAILAKYVYSGTTLVNLAKAKALLADAFIETWVLLPKSHRNNRGAGGHVCVLPLFIQNLLKVRMAHAYLTEVQLMLPAPSQPVQPPAQPVVYSGITLGEVLGEE